MSRETPRSKRKLYYGLLAIIPVALGLAAFRVIASSRPSLLSMAPPISHISATHRTQPKTTPSKTVNPCIGNSGKLLLVNIAAQHMWACEDAAVVRQSPVTTGRTIIVDGVDDTTPVGAWKIYAKYRDIHLRGSDANGSWDDPVQYWMPYDGSVGFHDASWQTFPFGSSQYQTGGSHGCVHLPADIAAWVYGWAPIGTRVEVVAS